MDGMIGVRESNRVFGGRGHDSRAVGAPVAWVRIVFGPY